MNRKARRALKSEVQWRKLCLRGRYLDAQSDLSAESMAMLITVLRMAVDDLDGQAWTDSDLFDSHAELMERGILQIFVAFQPEGLSVRTEINLPGYSTLGGYWGARRASTVIQ